MTVLINYFLKIKYFAQKLKWQKLHFRLFDIVQQTNIQDQRKFRIIGDVEIKVNNRTNDFSLTKKCQSKWSQNSIIRNFVRKWNKLPRALRKENQRKNFKKNERKRCKKDTEEFQWTKKLKALKVYVFKIIQES